MVNPSLWNLNKYQIIIRSMCFILCFKKKKMLFGFIELSTEPVLQV